MTVTVDYGQGTIALSVQDDTFVDPGQQEASNRAEDVSDYLDALETSADFAASEALNKIRELQEFSPAIGPVDFNTPPPPAPAVQPVVDADDLTLTNIEADVADVDVPSKPTTKDAKTYSFSTPSEYTFTAPDAPELDPDTPTPQAPAGYTPPSVVVPELNIPDFVPGDIAAPNLSDVVVEPLTDIVIDPLVVEIDTSLIDDAIERLEGVQVDPPDLPDYVQLIPDVFTAISGMIDGQLLDVANCIVQQREARHVVPALDRRVLHIPAEASQYDSWLDATIQRRLDGSDEVFEAVVAEDIITAGYQLGVAACRLLTDIELALYDLRFERAKSVSQTQLLLAKATADIYNARVAELQAHAANYNAAIAQIIGQNQGTKVAAKAVEVVGDLNKATARNFAISEGVKGSEVDAYKARASTEESKLRAYRAKIEALQANVLDAQLAVTEYQGTVVEYGAKVDRVKDEYDLYSANARAVEATNSAKATSVRADAARVTGLAAKATSSASKASAKAAELGVDAQIREATYRRESLANDDIGFSATVAGQEYTQLIQAYVTDLVKDGVDEAALADVGSAIARYTTSASLAASRAAQMAMTANNRIAQAYTQVYNAAGRAGASVASGKLSGFRASATLNAAGTLNASRSYATGYTATGTKRYSETDAITTSGEL